MENCHICRNAGVVEVTDTEEIKPGLYAPIGKRGGCPKHPPVALKISSAGEITLVAPTGWTITNSVLVKNG